MLTNRLPMAAQLQAKKFPKTKPRVSCGEHRNLGKPQWIQDPTRLFSFQRVSGQLSLKTVAAFCGAALAPIHLGTQKCDAEKPRSREFFDDQTSEVPDRISSA